MTVADAPDAVHGRLARRRWRALSLLTAALLLTLVVAVGRGAMTIPPGDVLSILAEPLGWTTAGAHLEAHAAVLWGIRLPRVALGALVGACLGVSGGMMQGLFRNPLAEPGLVGVTGGAAFAAAVTLVLGGDWLAGRPPGLAAAALPLAAFAGGAACVALVHRAAVVGGRTSVPHMLLAGIACNALAFAGVGLLQAMADDGALRSVTFWMLGSLGGATWETVAAVAPPMLLPALAAPLVARPLDALQLGEAEAEHLGVPVERLKRWIVGLVALGVGAAVSVSGAIGFVGLVVPHLVRMAVASSHRVLLPASALLGAALLVAADLLARTVASPAELPVGVITTFGGTPFFLALLLRDRRAGAA